MGIRFYCPNGHRLNVKRFLAGKRGICPHCETRFRIPLQSQIPAGSPKFRPPQPLARARHDDPLQILMAIDANAPSPDLLQADPAAIEGQVVDPIEASPDALWYVRPPTGGQFGPARGDLFRDWIDEGRVTANSLIWREGWSQWKTASVIFPTLPHPRPNVFAEPIDLSAPAEPATVALASRSKTMKAQHRPRFRRKSIAAVVFLGLSLIVLLVVLAIVLHRSS